MNRCIISKFCYFAGNYPAFPPPPKGLVTWPLWFWRSFLKNGRCSGDWSSQFCQTRSDTAIDHSFSSAKLITISRKCDWSGDQSVFHFCTNQESVFSSAHCEAGDERPSFSTIGEWFSVTPQGMPRPALPASPRPPPPLTESASPWQRDLGREFGSATCCHRAPCRRNTPRSLDLQTSILAQVWSWWRNVSSPLPDPSHFPLSSRDSTWSAPNTPSHSRLRVLRNF